MVRAKNLKNVESFGKNDPYVQVTVNSQAKKKKETWKTKVHNNAGSKAEWDETNTFDVKNATMDKKHFVVFEVKDKDMMKSKEIG